MWSTRPVFISSTFRDMQAERDYLRNVVFPEIEERLHAWGRHLEWVDLRIGVAGASLPDEGERELQVLKVCLDEVRRCRPFLIVLLGDRYGWVPPPDRVNAAAREAGFSGAVTGRSVTDLEIDLGVLQNADQQTRSRFYFRDPLPYAAMPAGIAAEYADEDADASGQPGRRARDLQTRIARALPDRVRRYAAAWDERAQRVTGLETWGQQVAGDLWSEIESELAGDPAVSIAGPLERDRATLDGFLEDASRGFVGRPALLARAAAIAAGDSSAPWALSIEGSAGSGKSAFTGHLSRELSARDDCLLVHAAAAGLGFGSVDAMLRRWIATLAARAGVDAAAFDLSNPDRVDQTFASLLARVSDRERVVVLIDGLDQFEFSTRGRYATWVPREWPPNARLIVTANPCDASAALAGRAGVDRAEMPPLDAAEGRAIVAGVSARYHRTLDPEVIDVLLRKSNAAGPAGGSPLWLVLAAETLNLVDADDVAGAWTLKSGSAADQLRAMLIARAEALAPDLGGVYTATFDRAQKVFGAALTGTWLSLIAVSRGGWRQTDFMALLPSLTAEPWDELRFARLRRFFRGQVRQAGAHGQWGFAHSTMADAVREHPQVSSLVSDTLSAAIARHLLALPTDDALRQTETMIHLLSAHDWSGAARYYGGDLSDAELSGATDVLVGAALIPPEGDVGGGVWYVSQMLRANLDEAPYVEYAAQRVLYRVLERLRVRGPLDTQVRLGCSLIACFDTLKLLIPFTRVGPHLAAAYARVGDALFEQRKFKESEHFQTKGHETLLALLEREPDRLEWQRDLAVGLNKRGKTQEAQDDLAAALHSFTAGLELIQGVSNARPDDPLWKHDVATSHDLISGIQLKLGNVEAASASRTAAERLDPGLSDRADRDLDRQFRAAFAAGRRGREASARGNLGAAELSYASSVRSLEALVARDPASTYWLHALFVTAADLGRVQEQRGDEKTAASTLDSAIRIGERLVKLDDKRTVWWSDLANTSLRLMNLGLRHVNDPGFSDERRALLETRLAHTAWAFEKLVSLEPGNQGARERLTACRQNLATLRADPGRM